ncbi:hypothetical protein EIKCOROL_01836 [Eikenella corrodens ATCC 23834]|uniref:Uncharacterized protein n=1 Tax=Eikenella corrodens ATCC 23834 TaxID=546274 RepID=C0DWT3_EIKCO|nr:hypothetical protein EIKCOROL_01836 [Eikenella corrodens ATCC 23834]
MVILGSGFPAAGKKSMLKAVYRIVYLLSCFQPHENCFSGSLIRQN